MVFEKFIFVLCPSVYDLFFPKGCHHFFDLRHPEDEQVFFPEISSMFLYNVCSELVRYSSMFLHLLLIYFSLSLHRIFVLISLCNVSYFSLLFFTCRGFSIRCTQKKKKKNPLSHPDDSPLFYFTFSSWYMYLFHSCVHFLSFSYLF